MAPELQKVLKELPKQNQRQDSTNDQLADLRDFANKLGMYDAADIIRNLLEYSGWR